METIITNRMLLRDFKKIKTDLLSGKTMVVVVPQSKVTDLEIRIRQKQTPFQSFLEKVKKNPMRGIVRPEEDIF